MIDGVKEAALSERVEPNAAARRMGGGSVSIPIPAV
jgi:hypothetical protein